MEKCVHCGWSFNRTDPEDDCLCPDCEALVMASFPEPEALVLNGKETPAGVAYFAALFNR